MWDCPKCGEKIEDQFDSCWNCAGKQNASGITTSALERVLVVFIGLCVAIPLTIYVLHGVGFSRFCHRIADADRITIQGASGSNTITAEKVRDIVQAISSAHRDRGSYAAAFSFRTSFYHGTNYLGEVRVCSDLFLFEGRQYLTRYNALCALNVPQGLYDSTENKGAR